MGTRSQGQTTTCNPGAVVITMALGILLGLISAAVMAVGTHVVSAAGNPTAASPSIVLELYFFAIGGLLMSAVATGGAAIALILADHRLQLSRMAQGGIAGVGAVLAGGALFAVLGSSVALNHSETAGILVHVAASSFGLMCIRAGAHRSVI